MKDNNGHAVFIEAINTLCISAYRTALGKGFHDIVREIDALDDHPAYEAFHNANNQACMARVMSEVGEAVEAMRAGNPSSEKIPAFSHVEEELADACIRIFDYCGSHQFNLGGAILAKMEYNAGRPHMHGKNS